MATKSKENPEQHRICNVVESRKTERDWNIGNAIAASAIAASREVVFMASPEAGKGCRGAAPPAALR